MFSPHCGLMLASQFRLSLLYAAAVKTDSVLSLVYIQWPGALQHFLERPSKNKHAHSLYSSCQPMLITFMAQTDHNWFISSQNWSPHYQCPANNGYPHIPHPTKVPYLLIQWMFLSQNTSLVFLLKFLCHIYPQFPNMSS